MAIHLDPLNGPFGVEILGLDLSEPLDDSTLAAIMQALAEHAVVLFRRQDLAPADLVRFTQRLGPMRIPLNDQYAIKGHAGLHRVSNVYENGKPIGLPDAGVTWHSDGAYMEKPDSCTLLYAIEVPRDAAGRALGDTVFANTEHAYRALPHDMQRLLEGRRAVFSVLPQYDRKKKAGVLKREELTETQRSQAPAREHPVIRTHPVTGRKCIYASDGHTTHIVDMPAEQSRRLLDRLHQHILDPRFRYSHSWNEGDVLVWDNRSLQHSAKFDYQLPQRRLMYRTSCTGSIPV